MMKKETYIILKIEGLLYMQKRFFSLFKTTSDKIEKEITEHFDFLIKDHGFEFEKLPLGDAVDKNGDFFFYGPLNAYQIYNESVCINILHLVQRNDYNVYITDKKSEDQIYIRNGTEVSLYDFSVLAKAIQESVLNSGKIFGYAIEKSKS